MSHARIVLQTVGAQDTYLTKNAKHTHFKKNYRKHTLYGTDWNIINANYKNIDDYVSPNSQHYFRIENNGDLVKDIYLRIKKLYILLSMCHPNFVCMCKSLDF